jgi:hypothetical protein
MSKLAMNFCDKCKKIEMIPFSQEDINHALENGGLFTKIVDHGDHMLSLKIDCNGSVRRETIFQR